MTNSPPSLAQGSSFSLRRKLSDLPIPRKLALIIGLFCMVVACLLALSYVGMEILSGCRAYVSGEALYSKAQKEAIYYLTRYALSRQEADYQKYLVQIQIPVGDHQARLELFKPEMDYLKVAQGLIQGRNHPADVRIIVLMARELHNNPYMSHALLAWGNADRSIGDLQHVAGEMHQEISHGHPTAAHLQAWINEIDAIDARVTPFEDDFSYTLGVASRWLKRVLLIVMLAATGFFLSLALIAAFLISRHLCLEIDQLRENARRIAAGDYHVSLHTDSKDEIGDLARTFQEMAVQREEAERLKDEFFANVSHELRTPLTLILSPLESMLSGDHGVVDSRAEPLLKTMHNNTVRLLQLVNGLLDFSKLNAGKLPSQREPVRIAELTETIFKDFQPMIQEKKIQAQLQADPPEAVVMMDRYFYERILFNLLSNAVKFTRSGGDLKVRLQWADERLTLSVSDTGIGIPPHELRNIFQRFRQVEGSSTRRFEGTGLGLALVKELTGLLGGTVEVESTVGHGSTFTVKCSAPFATTLPVSPNLERAAVTMKAQQYDLQSAPSARVTAAGEEPMPKVLLAEDNAEMASYIALLLQPFCQTRIVRDGDAALKEVRTWSPDLVLTDVMMPERDGLSLCRDLKADPVTAGIPVVMLTALTHREALLEGWKAGANEYLFKPFHPKELVTRVQSLLKAIQDQKRAQEKIVQLNENLRRYVTDLTASNQELEAFSYSVSHDLRTPLRAIEGFTNQLLTRSEAPLDRVGQDDLQRIRVAVQQMEQLIDDLLEFSRVPRSDIELESVDLSACVHEIAQKVKEAHPDRPVDYVVAPGVTTQGDPRLLRIALENLVQNAWKFTQHQLQPKIEFGVSDRAGEKTFFVRDNGVGFNMNYADYLFKPFHRLHKPQDFPGTGLGLALVERIIHRHGGRLWAESEENKGATFYFTVS